MGRTKITDIDKRAITKTVSTTQEELNIIIKVHGTLTKGVKVLAIQSKNILDAIEKENKHEQQRNEA